MDPAIIGEDRRRAVALMHVEIDHQCPPDAALLEQHRGRDRDVVEQAKAGAVVGEGMVAAACGVAGEAVCSARRAVRTVPALAARERLTTSAVIGSPIRRAAAGSSFRPSAAST